MPAFMLVILLPVNPHPCSNLLYILYVMRLTPLIGGLVGHARLHAGDFTACDFICHYCLHDYKSSL